MLWLCIRLPRLERLALTRLAVWAQQWSSWVSLGADTPGADTLVQGDTGHGNTSVAPGASYLWLEIGASLKIFGGHAVLRANVAAALEPFGHAAHTAIAPTPQAARLLTHVREPRVLVALEALQPRLVPLQLDWLALPAAALAGLRAAGFRRIGEVLAMPVAALAQRFGPEAGLYLQRLCGTAPEPMPAVPFPDHYHGRAEFDYDVCESLALLFPLQRLLWELQGYLRAADRALQHCTLRFTHRDQPDTGITLRRSLPSRDAAQWLLLAREQLGGHALAAPVRALHLLAHEFIVPAAGQGDFFAPEAGQVQALHEVLDRLRARLGTDAVMQLHVTPDYRPERAWYGAPGVSLAPGHAEVRDDPPRPCWLLREPRMLAAPPRLVAGPERIESGWWDHADMARDYYLARAADGARQWIFQDLRSGAWYLHGLWA